MPLGRIIYLVSSKMGLDPAQPSSRETMLRFVNEAAMELYSQSDPPGSLMEWVIKVNGDQTCTLPNLVGQLRAVRECASMQAWHINQMRPRYNEFNWKDQWRNYRLRDKQALQATVTNQSVGVITVADVENPPIIVTVSGPTPNATSIQENIVMDALSKQTVNTFNDYTAVSKDRPNNCDVTLSDVDGKVLTVIPNNELYAEYQVIDISTCPWLPQNTSPLDNYVEILFKKKLTYLQNDNDIFPAYNDYDYVIVNKVMQLWNEEQGNGEVAVAYDTKANRTTARINEDYNCATEDEIALRANPHDIMLPRIGTGLRRRYRFFGKGRY